MDAYPAKTAPVISRLSDPPVMLHIVFAGNPGVGKSLLANTLIGRPAFDSHSCPSPTGLEAPALHTVESNGIKFSDTPGLDSVSSRARAAREISRAINAQTELKLVFVVTLESGRVRPADVATIDVILCAVESVNARAVNNSFSLIINRCDPTELELLRDDSVRDFVALRFAGRFKLDSVNHVLCLRDVRDLPLDGPNSKLLSGSDRSALSAFVFDAPILTLSPPVDVNAHTYDQALRNASSELDRLRTELDGVTNGSWFWGLKMAVSFVFATLGRAAWLAVRAFL